jgi:hypothetical protein
MATQLAVGTVFHPNMKNASGQGVIQIVKGNTNVYLYGSLNGTDYVLIETFSADTIKELVLCDKFKISGSATDQTTTIDTSKAYISETRFT